MGIIYSEDDFGGKSSVLVMGMFDGVHAAHQALIRRAMALAEEMRAECVVCTFDRHPLSVLRPERSPKMLLTLEERVEKIRHMGVEWVLVKPFTRELAEMQPEVFLRNYIRSMNAKAVVAGFNYTFGKRAAGNADLIRAMARTDGFRAEIMDAVTDGGDKISSTLIRELIEEGDAERAARLMNSDV